MYTFLQNTFQSEHILNNYPAPILEKFTSLSIKIIFLSKSTGNLSMRVWERVKIWGQFVLHLFYHIFYRTVNTLLILPFTTCLKKKKKEVDKGLGKQHSKHIASHRLHKLALYFFKLGSLLGEILTCKIC